MSANSFGKLFKITTFGESHGFGVGVIIDGCPSGLEISQDYIQEKLNERRPGFNPYTTSRQEEDKVQILSGIYQNKTLGTPIALLVQNKDQRSEDYDNLAKVFRPSHADFVWHSKYEHVDPRGGGRSSARETVGRVAASAVAYKILEKYEIKIQGFLHAIGGVAVDESKLEYDKLNYQEISKSLLLCPDYSTSLLWENKLKQVLEKGDSLGAIIQIIVQNCPIGLGEPVFDKLNADLAKAIFSIPAVKGLEFGKGFELSSMFGSEGNDQMVSSKGKTKVDFVTNNNGGILGGISTGEDIMFKIAIKPTSSIKLPQQTVDSDLNKVKLEIKGRHDPCIGIRAVSVCKAMTALVIADHILYKKAK
ncbi:Chorismate synthase [Candidatus Hepatincolaceae symbiont of Richtersius coronifer]